MALTSRVLSRGAGVAEAAGAGAGVATTGGADGGVGFLGLWASGFWARDAAASISEPAAAVQRETVVVGLVKCGSLLKPLILTSGLGPVISGMTVRVPDFGGLKT